MNAGVGLLAADKIARVAGRFYLGYFVAAVLASAVGHIGPGDAPPVYQAIVTNAGSFRLGLVIALISGFLFLMAAWGLYVLLRPVNKHLALFFGTWLFPLGYLVYKSTFLPRLLGVLLVLDGIGVLIWFLQALLLPDYRAISLPGVAVSFVAELGLALWLLVKAVKVVDSGAALPRKQRLPASRGRG